MKHHFYQDSVISGALVHLTTVYEISDNWCMVEEGLVSINALPADAVHKNGGYADMFQAGRCVILPKRPQVIRG